MNEYVLNPGMLILGTFSYVVALLCFWYSLTYEKKI